MRQRVVIGMFDGLGADYFETSRLPEMKRMAARGYHRTVDAVMPTVTNANNVSIACGAWPAEHGITGNSYLDEATGQAEYMESGASILVPTILQKAAERGEPSALLTCKVKTINLLAAGATFALAAERPPAEFVARYGAAPDIYSPDINYWLWTVAVDLLRTRSELRVLYVHTTDYPMHMWAPGRPESQEHLSRLDVLVGEAYDAARDAAFLFTADHGMNFKTRCWDLSRACRARGLELRFALSAERDRYVKHHRTFGGTAWVWVKSPSDLARARATLEDLPGVEAVLSRDEFAQRFRSHPARIGDLCVLGDRDTVFGELAAETENLDPGYRSHGSLHELPVPLVVYNAPPPAKARANLDLARGWM